MIGLADYQVVVMEPRSFTEMSQAVDTLWQYKSVVLNLTKMEPEQAQRAVDFIAGATYALQGNHERIGEGIIMFIPGMYKKQM
jgi:cell division inhibitor SepF